MGLTGSLGKLARSIEEVFIQKKHFTIVKQSPQTIDGDRFRFDRFILFVEEWIRRKLRV
jgi:putative transposase